MTDTKQTDDNFVKIIKLFAMTAQDALLERPDRIFCGEQSVLLLSRLSTDAILRNNSDLTRVFVVLTEFAVDSQIIKEGIENIRPKLAAAPLFGPVKDENTTRKRGAKRRLESSAGARQMVSELLKLEVDRENLNLEVAEALGCSERVIRNWTSERSGPSREFVNKWKNSEYRAKFFPPVATP